MKPKTIHPKRPVRAALVMFILLCGFYGLFMPFSARLQGSWPYVFGYCALLSIAVIGIVRMGVRVLLLLGVTGVMAIAMAIVGNQLTLRTGRLDAGSVWFTVASNLLYALAASTTCLSLRGWWLYFSETPDAD
ncbi:MAG: hypothetical protein R3C01_16680 [Planctomycetaceae bacterium]